MKLQLKNKFEKSEALIMLMTLEAYVQANATVARTSPCHRHLRRIIKKQEAYEKKLHLLVDRQFRLVRQNTGL